MTALPERLRASAQAMRGLFLVSENVPNVRMIYKEDRDRIARELEEAAGALEAGRKPDGYAYEYESPFGGIRFNNGEPVNGSKPTRAIPYWLGNAPAAKVAQEGTAGVATDQPTKGGA